VLKRPRNLIFALAVFAGLVGGIVVLSRQENTPSEVPPPMTAPPETPPPVEPPPPVPEPTPEPTLPPPPPPVETGLAEPVAEFKTRITKKSFGIYITPQNSPVQPEKFTGYHTGVDAEYDDVSADVPVRAIESGIVVRSQTVSGYGGVMVVRHPIKGSDKLVLYGHLDPMSMKSVNASVTKGEQIAILGEGFTSKTSGERKHLHFAILAKSTVDWKGYVQNQSELSGWHDPLTFY